MRALVIGGGGFLGARIAEMLFAGGHRVTVFGRADYPRLSAQGMTVERGDIRDAAAVERAAEGQDAVFHVAALTGIWGPRRDFWNTNVLGTRNVLSACRKARIAKLVYTSSPSVVFGREPLCGVDESQPYPRRYLADYPETKALAEREVLAANSPALATVALRPHLIWGPGDPHLIPRVLERARRGRLVLVGDGRNLVDITYIDNAAEAHLLAAEGLQPNAGCAGKAYFISQGEPVALWTWLGQILTSVGLGPVRRKIGFRTAYAVGAASEAVFRVLGLGREPQMTRFLATQLAKSHYFNIQAAKRDFGYGPRVSTEEGLDRLLAALRKVPPSY